MRRPSSTARRSWRNCATRASTWRTPRSAIPTRLPRSRTSTNFSEYDEVIVSTLPLQISKWLRVDLPRKAKAATGLPVTHVVGSES